ncbi:hypothetical protein K6U06_20765 [Acidiferrimicrobium sp. IK]|uniref:hypothetical protein n=1 Tax=Acidiferrimicrobium sp. IK TaxID=2871700 RepID=UPI0021CAF133|nr:hypothetical protein [Acidiferrimicrobium sp. IK]MCU4186810.1 hypothetical protein [Acidiferrimicrobium sp. IK]
MTRPGPLDELFVHQTPQLLGQVEPHHPYWRESYFFDLHRPDAAGDVVFFTLARYPAAQKMDSLQMGRVAGESVLGLLERPYGGDAHTTDVGAARVEVVTPFEELRLWADPAVAAIGLDVTFRARTEPYALRRGTMRAGDEIVWDQSHILQSGTYTGTYTAAGVTYDIDGWVGQRDHSWGIRDHGRCPLWMWLQLQFDDGFLGVWHWELPDGARVYTDGCWAPADRSEPIPVVDFRHDLAWRGADGAAVGYGTGGEAVAGLGGSCTFTLRGGQSITVEAAGRFDRPYEPFHRGGLSQMRVRADDGREGSAIYEITGARHHRYFPDTVVEGILPS